MSGNKKLGVLTLAMINVTAIISLRNLPMTAEYGLAAIFYIAISSIIFFIPTALVSAELATGWPKKGGVYLWVKEGLGPRWGFLAIWLQWIENVIWYPTILTFATSTFAFVINPSLADNKIYTFVLVLVLFWGSTLLNFRGMKASGAISSIGGFIGTIIPGALIIILGVIWLLMGNPSQIPFTVKNLVPDMSNIGNIVLLVGVLLGFAGMEMSAVHAQEVSNPQRNYPRAILLATIIILVLSVLGSLSISIVVPVSKLSIVSGIMEAFTDFFNAYHMKWLIPIIAFLTAVGAIAMASTWIVGPSKGLLATAEDGDIPRFFQKKNKYGMPVAVLFVQGVIVTIISFVILFMPDISSSFWIMTDLTTQLYLGMYLLMFASAIVLRYKKPEVNRTYRVPGGNPGMWIIAGLGILSSIFAVVIGFFPPSQLQTGGIFFYEMFLGLGTFFMFVIPIIIYSFRRPGWVGEVKDTE